MSGIKDKVILINRRQQRHRRSNGVHSRRQGRTRILAPAERIRLENIPRRLAPRAAQRTSRAVDVSKLET